MKILALESSACAASVAIAEDGKLLGEAFLNTGLTHSQTLLPLVHGLLKMRTLRLMRLTLLLLPTARVPLPACESA